MPQIPVFWETVTDFSPCGSSIKKMSLFEFIIKYVLLMLFCSILFVGVTGKTFKSPAAN